ncbi:MAG: translation initiation factor IF-2 N-terminal domain-containing protein, partial [Pyrinomonadaceae bacterium]
MSANVRIYDLARELKQEPKRLIEDLRREGADVSVPSNSVTKELAEKVRNKYFPKVEIAQKRTIKVIKKAAKSSDDAEDSDEISHEEIVAPQFVETPVEVKKLKVIAKPAVAKQEEAVAEEDKSGVRIKKMVARPKVEEIVEEETEPEIIEPETIEAETEETSEETEAVVAKAAEETVEEVTEKPNLQTTRVFRPTGTQVKVLTLTSDAIKKGLKPGEKIVAPVKPEKEKATERLKDRKRLGGGRGGRDLRGTPGETATPQTVYTPTHDNRKKFGRNAGKKGGRVFDNK